LKIITERNKIKIGEYLLDIIADTIMNLKFMTLSLERSTGMELLNKQIDYSPVAGMPGLTLRDRYGLLCDTLINRSLDIASILGFNDDDFRAEIDECVGSGWIYDGEYTQDRGLSPRAEDMELSKGSKRWWAPSRGS
jgi:hypothetical protein